MHKSLIAASLFAGLALSIPGTVSADAGHKPNLGHSTANDTAYGRPGDAKKTSRTILLTMRESDGKMFFVPARIDVRLGEQIKFVMTNSGMLDHEMVLATLAENLKHQAEMVKNPDMEHDDPNAKRLKPKARGEIVWQFTKAGEFDFSCLIPGHRESGMHGMVVVK